MSTITNADSQDEKKPTNEAAVKAVSDGGGTVDRKKVDLRILKTKKSLKSALRQLLEEKSFDKISVKEICERAMVSRITFYNYYSDKYALLEELFEDLSQKIKDDYAELQKNNTENDPSTAFENLLTGFLMEYDGIRDIIDHISLYQDAILLYPYFRTVNGFTEEIIEHYADTLKPNYDPKKLSVSLVFAIYGYLHFSNAKSDEDWAQAQKDAMRLLRDLINSNLFTPVEK